MRGKKNLQGNCHNMRGRISCLEGTCPCMGTVLPTMPFTFTFNHFQSKFNLSFPYHSRIMITTNDILSLCKELAMMLLLNIDKGKAPNSMQ